MQIISSPKTPLLSIAIDGNGTSIVEGAVVIKGSTDEQDRGCGIVGSGACADAIGILQELHTYDETGKLDTTMEDGLIYTRRKVMPFLPGCIVAAEYDQTSTVTMSASVTSTTATHASLEDDIDGGWIYIVSGTGIGQLMYIKTSAAATATYKSASTVTGAENDTFIKILPAFHPLLAVNTAADKLASQAAAGGLLWVILKNQYRLQGEEGWIDLDPTVHHNLLGGGLNSLGIKFQALLAPRDTVYNSGA